MKKNKMMRLASGLMVAVLLTTSMISGTFAKYVTTTNSSDSARVAKWGFDKTTIEITDLFVDAYDETVDSVTEDGNTKDDVIAPGTTGSDTINFTTENSVAPEVDYKFAVEASSTVDQSTNAIINNPNIKWAFYKANSTAITWGTFAEMITAINNMSKTIVKANTFPDLNEEYTVAWKWMFDAETDGAVDNDENDTKMGNADVLETIDLTITITATQLD